MLYAVIADIHGNYHALQAVLEDARKAGAEQFLFLGDYVTDFPFTKEIMETLLGLKNAVFISGNREQYMDSLDPAQRYWEQYAGLFVTRDALGEKNLAWMRDLPRSLHLTTPDGACSMFLEHEFPVSVDPKGQKRPASGELDELFPKRDATHEEVAQYVRESFLADPQLPKFLCGINAQVFLHGHSHLQYAVDVGGTLFLNPGSCGLPLDHQTGAPYTLLHYRSGDFRVEERRVPYDVEAFVDAVTRSPEHRKTEGWDQLNIWQLRAARDHNRVFFRFLNEEQRRTHPQTAQEQNEAFRTTLFLTREYYEKERVR